METVKPLPGGQKTSKLAVASLVLGLSGLLFWCLTGLAGAICGHVAMAKIKNSGGVLTGEGLALAGIIAGYITTALSIVVLPIAAALAIPLFSAAVHKDPAATAKAIANGAVIYSACKQFAADHGGHYPEGLEQLLAAGYLNQPESLHPVRSDYGLNPEAHFFRLLVPGAREDSISRGEPILVSVVPIWGNTRVVVTSDGQSRALSWDGLEEIGIDPAEMRMVE